MYNINKQLPKGKEFTERARYIFDWKSDKNYIKNIDKKIINNK